MYFIFEIDFFTILFVLFVLFFQLIRPISGKMYCLCHFIIF